MRIAKKYSHLNGEERVFVHEENICGEILQVIDSVDAGRSRTEISEEKYQGEAPYTPVDPNAEFGNRFSRLAS